MKRDESRIFTSIDERFVLELPSSVSSDLERWCRGAGTIETGGILLGCYDERLQTALVAHITGPPADSRAGATWFERGTRGLQVLLARKWNRRRHFYLGEWHYHPCGPLLPSSTDLKQMRDISQTLDYRCPEPLLIIAGTQCSGTFNAITAIPAARCFVFPRGEAHQELFLPNKTKRSQ